MNVAPRLATQIISIVFLAWPCFGAPVYAKDATPGPRPGKYVILSYGAVGNPPLRLGYFVLDGKTYKAYLPGDKLSGKGQWQFDTATQTVIWKDGPYAGVWEGRFAIDRNGKTHTIRLKRNTIGTNSID